MGLLSILKKMKQKEKEMRLLILYPLLHNKSMLNIRLHIEHSYSVVPSVLGLMCRSRHLARY